MIRDGGRVGRAAEFHFRHADRAAVECPRKCEADPREAPLAVEHAFRPAGREPPVGRMEFPRDADGGPANAVPGHLDRRIRGLMAGAPTDADPVGGFGRLEAQLEPFGGAGARSVGGRPGRVQAAVAGILRGGGIRHILRGNARSGRGPGAFDRIRRVRRQGHARSDPLNRDRVEEPKWNHPDFGELLCLRMRHALKQAAHRGSKRREPGVPVAHFRPVRTGQRRHRLGARAPRPSGAGQGLNDGLQGTGRGFVGHDVRQPLPHSHEHDGHVRDAGGIHKVLQVVLAAAGRRRKLKRGVAGDAPGRQGIVEQTPFVERVAGNAAERTDAVRGQARRRGETGELGDLEIKHLQR